MAKQKKKEIFLNWAYINDKKDVAMVMDNETFEAIKHALAYFKNNYSIDRYESDICNYGYTSKGE